MWTAQQKQIHAALGGLAAACGFDGESGTEKLFAVLCDAIERVQENWHVVERSHRDGLCLDVNALLVGAIVAAMDTDKGEQTTTCTAEESEATDSDEDRIDALLDWIDDQHICPDCSARIVSKTLAILINTSHPPVPPRPHLRVVRKDVIGRNENGAA